MLFHIGRWVLRRRKFLPASLEGSGKPQVWAFNNLAIFLQQN
jgi:hypothetical protein